MRLTIEQHTLSALLSRVLNAVEKRNTIPVLANILLKADGNTLTAVATDLDLEVTTTAEATVTTAGATTVNAATLSAIVAKLTKGKLVTLAVADGVLQVTSGRSNLSLATLPIEDFPHLASAEYTSTFNAPQDQVQRLLDLSSFAMSTEETRYYLQGVYLHSVNGKARAVATDGHRLAQIDCQLEAEFPGVIVPRKTVALVRGLLGDGDCVVSVSETKVKVDLGHTVVVSKVIDGTFPDYTRIIPTSHKSEVVVSAADVKQAAALVSLVSGEKVRAVKVGVSGAVLTLTVRSGAEVGVEEVDAVLTGDDVEAGFNSKYLADILQQCNGDNAVFRFNSGLDPVVIRPEDDPLSLFVCMPMLA